MSPRRRTKKAPIRESDLASPVKGLLVRCGYDVRSEVHDCDLAGRRGEELVIVELKCSPTMGLLVQAARRQRIGDVVYVAVPRPPGGRLRARWKGIEHVLRRLELGLILVDFRDLVPVAEVAFHPMPLIRRSRPRERQGILSELAGRSSDFNLAGTRGRKLVTAYREAAIRLACDLDRIGPSTPRALRALGNGSRTLGILADNVYGWFERISRGTYGLTAQGRQELATYPVLVLRYGLPGGDASLVPEEVSRRSAPGAQVR